MDTKLTEDKIKPFRLVKYFAYTGLVVIFLVTLILSVFNTHWVKSMQRKKTHTNGPMLAGFHFTQLVSDSMAKVHRVQVDLYGSSERIE